MSEKIEILEQVGDSELIVGEVYADNHRKTFLEFLGYDKGINCFDFRYYAGRDNYYFKIGDIIPFNRRAKTTFRKTKITKS